MHNIVRLFVISNTELHNYLARVAPGTGNLLHTLLSRYNCHYQLSQDRYYSFEIAPYRIHEMPID